MRNRRSLQIIILAAALVLGFVPNTFNGLSVLAILLAGSALLLQPGVMLRLRRPVLRLVK
ncbi:MAG TPA: hypothetical protein VF867_02995 [Arthrobacter sp.]